MARWAADLAHAVSLQLEAVGVVDEAVEDGVGDGGIADDLVPVLDRHLAGDDGRAAFVAVVDDFQQIAALLAGERCETPIVEDQQLDPRERLEQPGIAAVAAGERERLEQPRQRDGRGPSDCRGRPCGRGRRRSSSCRPRSGR